MQRKRKRRIYVVISLLMGASAVVGLSLYALRHNVDLYYTPTQLVAQRSLLQREIRVGGIVAKNSVHHAPHSLRVHFVLTDRQHAITVYYQGLLPSLFREKQGIVVQGILTSRGIFVAQQVLAKHDATYRPPGVNPQ